MASENVFIRSLANFCKYEVPRPNDYHGENRIEILCRTPVRMPRDLRPRPEIFVKSWNHRTLVRMFTLEFEHCSHLACIATPLFPYCSHSACIATPLCLTGAIFCCSGAPQDPYIAYMEYMLHIVYISEIPELRSYGQVTRPCCSQGAVYQ